jgi:hypothetical protein
MAISDTNVQMEYQNFSLGPQLGTFTTLDTSNPTNSRLLVKNNTGALVASYDCSSNLTVDVGGLEYVGARDLTAPYDGATFFTFQRYTSSKIVIRRWEIDTGSLTFQLKATIVKTDTGVYGYDCNAFAVEHWQRTFAADASSDNNLEINDLSSIDPGDRLWLGPSTDTDNPGAVEEMIVDYTTTDGLGNHFVYFTADFNYEYVTGDPITFSKYIYVFTDLHPGDNRGAIYKLDAYTGANINYAIDNIFGLVTAGAWNDYYDLPTIFRNNMLLHIDPSLGYVITRAQDCWTNVEDDLITAIPVVDLAIDDIEIFKLQDKVSFFSDDDGTVTTASWSNYNYHEDSHIQYSNSLKIWVKEGHEPSNIAAAGSQIDIACTLISQYGFPVASKEIQFYSDDPGGSWNPADGKVTTDANGYAELIFTLGINTSGHVEISARAPGASVAVLGSQYIWCRMPIISMYDFTAEQSGLAGLIHQFSDDFDTGPDRYMVKQISEDFLFTTGQFGHIRQLLKFNNPGGNWVGGSPPSSDKRTIRQLQDFQSEVKPQQWDATSDGFTLGPPPSHYRVREVDHYLRQIEEVTSQMRMSQLYQAFHIDEYLNTDETLDQFIFILEVIPAWYSVKNPIVQDIFIRISPFAYDLNQSTFIMRVKNDWTRDGNFHTTGWKNVTADCTITPFGSPTGLQIEYDPAPDTWEYNSRVWVWIQVYDEDPSSPNLMDVVYWWYVIDDFRAPTITNQYPTPFSTDQNVDTYIQFDVLDTGYGIDPDAIMLTVEGSIVEPLTLTVITDGYRVKYEPPVDFFYGQQVEITIEAQDLNDNVARDSYYFTTGVSEGPWFHGAFPRKCAEGIIIDSIVMLQVYGLDHGINTSSILVKIDRKTREIEMRPIIYRLS